MGTASTESSVGSGLGFLAMFGGAAIVLAFGGFGLLVSGSTPDAIAGTFFGAAIVSYLVLAPGAAGLYYRHREAFGWPGTLGSVLVVATLLGNGTNGLWAFVTGDALVSGLPSFAMFVALLVGSLAFGISVARAGELEHATAGGVLVAVGQLGAYLLLVALGQVGVELPALAITLLVSVPYATGWLLLGFDLVTEGDTEMPGAAADLQG